jgi:hypothetical protein
MGLGHSPRIVTDGLVLALDAANPKNYNLTAVEVLVVAGGGGGGGGDVGAGGGAGGLIYNSNFTVTPGSAVTVTVGDGGAGSSNASVDGSNGSNSVFGSLTAIGGGGGASWGSGSGQNGGSGGGSVSTNAVGQGTAGQGNNGGNGLAGPDYPQGGGGGAGGVGQTATIQTKAGDGGVGLEFPQFASVGGSPAGWFAGGGGGGVEANTSGNSCIVGSGGLGGGGNGGRQAGTRVVATSGVSNTGGGGGGDDPGQGGNGGSGIVIVRYPGPQRAIGGTVTSSGGYTIHTFTTVETTSFTPLVATNNSAILGLADFSGNNNFGTTVNSPTYNSANGGSVSFDGTDEYATVPANSGWAFGGNGTVEQWVYVAGNSGSNDRFWCVNNNSTSLDAYLDGASYNISFHGGSVGTTTTIPQNTWVYFVVVYTSGTIKVYFNTIEQGLTGTTTGYNITSNGTLYIGRYITAPYELNGRIASMKIYNRALTASEVQQNFNALRSRFSI